MVELELVDVAGIELSETRADVLKEGSELFLVVRSDRFACCTALSLLVLLFPGVTCPSHVFDANAAATQE